MTKLYNFRLSPELIEKAKEKAKQEDRSVSSLLRYLLKKYIELEGGKYEQ